MSYKIALCSSDKKNIDLHFGEINSVLVYTVNEEDGSFSFEEERKTSQTDTSEKTGRESGCSCGRDFVCQVSKAVADCQYFLLAKIGNRPHRFLQEYNVNCIEAPYPIDEAIGKLNQYYVRHKKRENHVF